MKSEIMVPKLSICMATYNRGKFIGLTLDSIMSQMRSDVELIVVDGASPDDTHIVMERYLSKYPSIRYYRETVNSGVDADYDKAVGYARGMYCWLMTDDDLMCPGAINRVIAELKETRDLVIVNSEVRNADLTEILVARQLDISSDRSYDKMEFEKFFTDCVNYLSFIGAVVIRREAWVQRDRSTYFGSLFIHVGVIFQSPPISNVYVISEPLISIRYGNAMWTSRGFEIWAFKWPKFIWSFSSFSEGSKKRVCHPAPWKRVKTLFYDRAVGDYSVTEFNNFIRPKVSGLNLLVPYGIAIFPPKIANVISVILFTVINRSARLLKFDLLRSRHATKVSRWLARILWA